MDPGSLLAVAGRDGEEAVSVASSMASNDSRGDEYPDKLLVTHVAARSDPNAPAHVWPILDNILNSRSLY